MLQEEFLGAPYFMREEMEERTLMSGVSIGLSWTAAGGNSAGMPKLALVAERGRIVAEADFLRLLLLPVQRRRMKCQLARLVY